jgi:hypothetical protein
LTFSRTFRRRGGVVCGSLGRLRLHRCCIRLLSISKIFPANLLAQTNVCDIPRV